MSNLSTATPVLLLPDAGPLITLAYADALEVLHMPGWALAIVDMVLHELTRNTTPTSQKLASWIEAQEKSNNLQIITTKTYVHYQQIASATTTSKSNLGEIAIQEAMNAFAISDPPRTGVFLFEDHKIARTSFLLPDNCRKVSTRAFLIFLEQKGWITSAAEIERIAIQNGRNFSQLRFPPG
ncbi:MAG: hypothetical protein Q8Q55_02135 [Undibacterium sp.]|nr:hypothetical protein [Undibacterium sp.]